jgi:hypothetical protein
MKIGAIRAQAACAWVQVQVQVQVHVRAGTGEAIFGSEIAKNSDPRRFCFCDLRDLYVKKFDAHRIESRAKGPQ